MAKSKKLQSRKGRPFVSDVKSFDGRQATAKPKRGSGTKNYALAKKLLDNYCLPD